MKQGMLFLLSVLLFLLTFSSAYAWTSYTHNWICDRAGLTDLNCAAADTPAMQSIYKDANFRNHHCTENSLNCSARKVADKFLLMNTNDTLGLAAHFYSDSMVPVHWYSTDYDTCHKIFEAKVEEMLRNAENKKYKLLGKNYDFSAWNISMQCIAKYGKVNKTVDLYADNVYMDSVAGYVAEKMGVEPAEQSKAEAKEYDLTPILIVMIVFIILVFVLFFYFGFKNEKK
jgi:hypothetical protein